MKTLKHPLIRKLLKPTFILIGLLALTQTLPNKTIDPWSLFNPKKISTVVFALTLIQFAGALILQLLGSRVGAVLAGFLGGLVSSTATMAALAKKSKAVSGQKDVTSEILIFLSATIAMLVEGIVIFLFGIKVVHLTILIIFFGPATAAGFMIFLNAKKSREKLENKNSASFDLLPVLKLSSFIVLLLSASKILQNFLGQSGLFVLTFVVSLFEIHGSFIANIQLHDSGAFDIKTLGNLAALSIASTFVSKLFLIYTLGSEILKIQVKKYTLFLSLSLALSWLLFLWVS